MKRLSQLLVLCLMVPAPSSAALYMKSHLHGSGSEQRPRDEVNMVFEGWFDGDRAMIRILESENSVYKQGKIFIDGTEMTLYDEAENTCTPWDLQAMVRFAGSVMESVSGIIELEFGAPEIEVLERKSGLSHLGRPVDYLKYRSNWSMSYRAPLMGKRSFDNRTVQEVWYDRALLDELPSTGVFMDPESFTTGYEEMDEAIAAGIPPVEGAVLKSVAVSTVVNQKGKEQTSTTTTEVTELDVSAADPAGGYTAPDDCQVVTVFPPGAAPEGSEGEAGTEPAASEDDKPLAGLKIGNPFKKKKKKDDG